MTRKRSTAEERRSARKSSRQSRKARTETGKVARGQFHTFHVQKPFCTPCRSIVQSLGDKYEIPIYNYKQGISMVSLKNFARRMKIELKTFENLQYGVLAPGYLPSACWASFSVPQARARWFEDIINYDGRMNVTKGSLDKRSYDRGQRGEIRTAWKDSPEYNRSRGQGGIQYYKNQAKVESSCSDGKSIWNQVNKIIKDKKK